MRAPTLLMLGVFVACAAGVAHAQAVDPTALFNEAVRIDLSGEGAAPRAFDLYRRAAEAGLPAAEFNVAIMFDSGRGTPADMAQAATWYARAATHGDHRAAYNLGQLYENGQGVPQNIDLARAWFKQSDLAAARERMSRLRPPVPRGGTIAVPQPVGPAAGSRAGPSLSGVELVWTSAQQPEPVRFFVELREVTASGSDEVYSGFVDTSSTLVTLPHPAGTFAWRVTALDPRAGGYMASPWTPFTIAGDVPIADGGRRGP